jgi:hypothetical protein
MQQYYIVKIMIFLQYFYDLIGYTKEEMERIFNNHFADLVIDDVSEIFVRIKKLYL